MQYEKDKSTLKLVINDREFEWFRQYITGAEIRKLGEIHPEDEIFLKIREPWEDELIEDTIRVDLARPGLEHFYSKQPPKEIKIVVNGREKPWGKKQISFEEVVILAYGKYVDKPTMVYTVAYEDGPKENPEGSMVRGKSVFVKNKMIFHATETDKS